MVISPIIDHLRKNNYLEALLGTNVTVRRKTLELLEGQLRLIYFFNGMIFAIDKKCYPI